MAEHHLRCRFFPRCAIHRGASRSMEFSLANKAEMKALREEGWMIKEIAVSFGTYPDVVSEIVRGKA